MPNDERTRHDDLHLLVASSVTGMIGATLYGLIVPASMMVVPLTYEGIQRANPSLSDLALGIAFGIGAMLGGALAWLVFVERRPASLLWRQSPLGRDWVLTGAWVIAWPATLLVIERVRLVGGFYGTADSGQELFVWAPTTLAVAFVVFNAVHAASYVVLRPIVDAWVNRHRVTSSYLVKPPTTEPD